MLTGNYINLYKCAYLLENLTAGDFFLFARSCNTSSVYVLTMCVFDPQCILLFLRRASLAELIQLYKLPPHRGLIIGRVMYSPRPLLP